MAEKVAARLRHNNMHAATFFIGMHSKNFGWLAINYKTPTSTNDGRPIYEGCRTLIKKYPKPGAIMQVQVTALSPQSDFRQLDLFEDQDKLEVTQVLNSTIDKINQKYGDFAITKAALLKKSEIPDVIAWTSRSIIPKKGS